MKPVHLVIQLGCAIALMLAATGAAHPADVLVPLNVTNPTPAARTAAPVSFGVPLPHDLDVRSVSALGVLDPSNRPVPLQATVLARWGGRPTDTSRPIKWVLLDFQASVPASTSRTFTLVRRAASDAPVSVTPAIRIDDRGAFLEVSTGASVFKLSRERFSVLEEARARDGQGRESVGGRARAGDGLEYRDHAQRPVRAARPDAVTVEMAGPLHAVVNVRGWFVDTAGKRTFLYYVARYHFHAGRPEARLLLTVTDRHDKPVAEMTWDRRWEQQQVSDLKVVLGMAEPAQSVFVPQDGRTGDVREIRLAADTGAHVRLAHLTPHSPRLVVADGQSERLQKGYLDVSGLRWLAQTRWDGHNGADYLVHDADGGRSAVQWVAPIAQPGRYRVSVSVPNIPGAEAYRAGKGVTYEVKTADGVVTRVVDQAAGWMTLGEFAFKDRVEVTLRATGTGRVVADALSVKRADAPAIVVDRERLPGLMQAFGATAGLAVAVPEFWQNAPREIVVRQDGRVEIGLLAGGPHHVMGGLGKTHEIVLAPRVRNGAESTRPDPAMLGGVLHALAPAAWYARANAVGYGPFFAGQDRMYDDLVAAAVAPGAPSLLTHAEEHGWYGWRNYGDFEIGAPYWDKGEAVEDWANGMMDHPTGLLAQYLRTGRHAFWSLGRAASWHLADIGLVKFQPFDEKFNGTVHRKGECPRRHSHVCQHPIPGQAFAHRALLLHYHLTGDSWLLETALMNVDYAYTLSAPRVSRPQYLPAAGRDMGWILGALLTGWEQTGEEKYRDLARQLFEAKVVKQYDPVTGAIIDPTVDDPYAPATAPMVQPWMVGYTGDALIYYHRLFGDRRAADMVVGLARFLRDFGMRRARVPAKGEPGFSAIIPAELAGKAPRYVLYNWTYEQTPTRYTVAVRQAAQASIAFDYDGRFPIRVADLRGKLVVLTSGRAAGKSFLLTPARDGKLSVECRTGTEGRCSNALERDGVSAGDRAIILQPGEYQIESVTYNFVPLNTLAYATQHSGDPSYVAVARELYAYAVESLQEHGFQGARQASDYLTFPHLFLSGAAAARAR